ncbi:uncharacterized protein EKO05_0007289 [Ascochyta rabiei]|uniref:Nucleic acid binding n=1 Tax=Didymella rabiei TaxID=5454 RepID=A0A163BUY9_DIDRA|nr:uncharacterized protein EKO05_0007289 [Ascochyta rabiei]KZM22014.1 nucleic acid binding [Ascochyta rabiei]UPX16908.1 hypothetical protein EKO05_0007289 [Ascochyta rabiei]
MSAPKVIAQGRFVLSRGFTTSRATSSILRAVSTTLPRRQLSSSVQFQQETVQTPATGPEVPLTATRNVSSGNNARSIAITKLPKRVVKADIEQLLRSAGVDVKRIQFRVDRFTFFSDSSCFIELGSKEQVQKATEALNGQQLHGTSLVVRPIKEDFYWDQGFKKDNRFFFHDEQTPSQAIQPLLQGRRYALQVENPGWINQQGSSKSANTTRREIVEKYFGPFGVEVIGALNPIWRHQKKEYPFLAHIDFASKEGAEQAAEALNDTEIEGKRVYLQRCTVNSSRAKQIGNVDQGVLAQLQESGFVEKSSAENVGA